MVDADVSYAIAVLIILVAVAGIFATVSPFVSDWRRARAIQRVIDEYSREQSRRDAQYRALFDTSGDYSEEPEDAETEERRFRRVRAEVAAERRQDGKTYTRPT